MLGKLARWLRLLGYDVVYYPLVRDIELIERALKENRIILTRDTRLIKRKLIKDYLLIRSDRYLEQLTQVIVELKLEVNEGDFFTRCLICNRLIENAEKGEVKDRVPPYVYRTQDSFYHCPDCGRIYWPGTHSVRAREKLKDYLCRK